MNKLKLSILQFFLLSTFIFSNHALAQEVPNPQIPTVEVAPTLEPIPEVKTVIVAPVINQAVVVAPKTVKTLNDYKSENIFVLFSALFVLLMTLPGIGLFYSGLVRKKNVISILVQTSFIFVVITLLWFIAGYSIALVDNGNSFFGSLKEVLLLHVKTDSFVQKGNVLLSEYVYILYHLGFAIITCALIVGSVAERLKFKAIILFSCGWLFLVYCPLAFMLWSGSGFAEKHGVLDWAGGLVVHVNAGVTGLMLALIAEKRQDFGTPIQPHNLALVFIGTAFLVVGWAGFNGGSSFDDVFLGAKAIICSFIAAATGGFMWALIEKYTRGSVSLVGVSSGLLVGLVAVTPAAGYIEPVAAVFFGLVPVPFCISALKLVKNKLNADDALDVFAVHGIGGIIGSIMTGYFAKEGHFLPQLYATIGVVLGVAVISYMLMILVLILCKGQIRYGSDEETIGLDLVEHGEELE